MRLHEAGQPDEEAGERLPADRPAQQRHGEQAVDPDLELAERVGLDDRIEGQREARHDGDAGRNQHAGVDLVSLADLQLEQRRRGKRRLPE